MKIQNPWSKEELAILLEYYPQGGSPLVRQQLVAGGFMDRTKSSISGKAWKYEMKSPLHHKPNGGCFQKGQAAHNKGAGMSEETRAKVQRTWFKKGEPNSKLLPYNHAISWRAHDKKGSSYWNIKISKGKWVHLHVWCWLQEKEEPAPGLIVHINDKAAFDAIVRGFGFTERPAPTEPEGLWDSLKQLTKAVMPLLELRSRAENMVRNSASLNLTDNYVATAISWRDKALKETIIKEHPQLIKANRQRLLNQRQIKQQQ